MLWKTEYLPWRQQIKLDLLVSSALCLGERVLERMLLPGLHRSAARQVTDDPARIDSMTAMFAEALGLFALVWVLNLSLYAISYLSTRPMKSFAPTLVAGMLMAFVFVASLSTWFQMPNPPPG